MECYPVKIGGHTDHVHILCLLSKKITLIKLLEEEKRSSSKWIKAKGERFANFHWQEGYDPFSVNPDDIKVVSDYIENQAEHYKKTTFQDEFRLKNMLWIMMNILYGIKEQVYSIMPFQGEKTYGFISQGDALCCD